jgi:glyoxylase-like metal-dependent hydrolase (beta-lactamase superfamily II)
MLVAPGIHHFETYPFNWYVIEQDSRLTLVDAGFPGHYDVFIAGLRSIGRELRDVDAVVLTHIHADHTGFAERVRRELNVPVYVHLDDIPASEHVTKIPPKGFLLNIWRPYVSRWILGTAIGAGVPRTESITGAIPFRDGEVLDVPGRPMMIHMPGHTAGECMLFLEDRQVLISGDAVITLNLLNGEHVPPRVPYRLVNDDDLLARRSIARLGELGTFTMLPGHGRPWKGTVEGIVEAAGVAELRADAGRQTREA